MKSILRNAGIALALAALTAGCASEPNTIINSDPQADFTKYRTYGFISDLATDSQGYDSLLSNFLKVAMSQEMDRRGLEYSPEPDLLINFYVNTREKITSRQVPTSEGTATGRVTEKKLQDLEGSVDRAVTAIMADYPIQPAN